MNDIPIPKNRREWNLIIMGSIGTFVLLIIILTIIILAAVIA